jgi:hypothetical protein
MSCHGAFVMNGISLEMILSNLSEAFCDFMYSYSN